MTKIRFGLLGIVLLGSSIPGRGCDVCGYSSGMQSLGLLPQSGSNYIGLHYLGYQARSEHPALFDKNVSEKSRQQYNNLQLSLRIRLSKRFQLLGFIPTGYYRNTGSDTTFSYTGIGDAGLQIGYRIPIKKSEDENRFLLLYAGIKVPSGKFIPADGQLLRTPASGSGSLDYSAGIAYTRSMRSWGYNGECSFLLTRPNKERYKFGNKSFAAGNIFLSRSTGKWTFMPQAGLRLEYSLHDYDNYDRKWLNEQSGGMLGFVTAGGQVLRQQWGMRLLAYVPAVQHYAGGYVHSGIRAESALFFTF